MNRYADHVYVIPEDDRNRQLADGFVLHHEVKESRIQVVPPAGGWPRVIEIFRKEYIPMLRGNSRTRVVMLIDFDGQPARRQADFAQEIPEEFKPRVFVIGSSDTPESLKRAMNVGYEDIGRRLASDCHDGTDVHWNHPQLRHNDSERRRLVQEVKPFLF